MFAAKTAVPKSVRDTLRLPVLNQAAHDAVTLFAAPSGYLFTDRLAATLEEQGCRILWLRIGYEDRDPATLLTSLMGAAQRLQPGIGSETLTLLKSNPGPLTGWRPHFDQLAQEFSRELPASSAIVLEGMHVLTLSQPILNLLCTNFLARLPHRMPRIVISHEPLPSRLLPENTISRSGKDLRVDIQGGLALAENVGAGLSADSIRRAIRLVEGREVTLNGVFSACTSLGPEFIQWAIKRAKNGNYLLAHIARTSLGTAETETLQALALILYLDYSHPKLLQAALGKEVTPTGPWLQSLTDRWVRVRSSWSAPLRSALQVGQNFDYGSIHRSANYLVEQGDQESAVRLYLELGDFSKAAQIIAQIAEKMANLGQWATLEHWLKQLPPDVLHDWPWLVYILGELYAVAGHTAQARSTFAMASTLFSNQHQQDGACQSLLAESALAAWEGHMERAQLCALTANVLAHASGLSWHQSIAGWQLGCLATATGKLDEALTYFGQATKGIRESPISELFGQAEILAQRQYELHRKRLFQQQIYLATKQSEQEVLEQLRSLINASPENLPAFLGTLGWTKTPLMFKLTTPPGPPEDLEGSPGLWQKMLSLLGLNLQSDTQNGVSQVQPFSPMTIPLSVNIPSKGKTQRTLLTPPNNLQPLQELPTASLLSFSESQRPDADSNITEMSPLQPELVLETRGFLITVCTLGPFRFSINDTHITQWPGTRGLGVFKYLLVNHHQEIPRDVLMDTFWRDSDPDSARNNLNVSLHSLRSTLRKFTEKPIILYNNGSYQVNPEIPIWIDLEEFEKHLQAGRHLEATGALALAIKEYEVAASLYQGDFLEEDLYEEWPVLTRERLRIACLDMMDHLSQIYFSQGQYAACVALSQQILERDNCREDTHCRLMRCYSRQGQQHLSLRQYQACLEALQVELQVDPEPATSQLAERIRRHEPV